MRQSVRLNFLLSISLNFRGRKVREHAQLRLKLIQRAMYDPDINTRVRAVERLDQLLAANEMIPPAPHNLSAPEVPPAAVPAQNQNVENPIVEPQQQNIEQPSTTNDGVRAVAHAIADTSNQPATSAVHFP